MQSDDDDNRPITGITQDALNLNVDLIHSKYCFTLRMYCFTSE